MKLKGKNKGFSLLELLVAVAILAVVVTPFLMAFLTTTRINASTKNQQRARFAATNVMEDIRSANAEAIINDTEHTTAITDDNGEAYYLYKTKQESDGIEYTVEAELDPRVVDGTATVHNAEDMANIYAMKNSRDAFYQLDATTDFGKIEELAEKKLNSRDSETLQQIYNSVNREIRIDIEDNDSKSGFVDVKVNVNYTVPFGANVEDVSTPKDQVVYSKEKDKLQNIYLFYNPLYNGNSRQARETITVVNKALTDCNVYLIRQDWPISVSTDPAYSENFKSFPFFKYCKYGKNSSSDDTTVTNNRDNNKDRNNNYYVNVRLQETNRDGSDREGTDVITYIRTNIEELSYDEDGAIKNPKHMRLLYSKTGDNGYAEDLDPPKAIDIMGLNSLVGTQKNNRVYKVRVKAYVEGDENNAKYGKYEMEATTE